jgi:hypothetical protein
VSDTFGGVHFFGKTPGSRVKRGLYEKERDFKNKAAPCGNTQLAGFAGADSGIRSCISRMRINA